MWKRCESTEVLGWIWKIVHTSGKILATPLHFVHGNNKFGLIQTNTGAQIKVNKRRCEHKIELGAAFNVKPSLLECNVYLYPWLSHFHSPQAFVFFFYSMSYHICTF